MLALKIPPRPHILQAGISPENDASNCLLVFEGPAIIPDPKYKVERVPKIGANKSWFPQAKFQMNKYCLALPSSHADDCGDMYDIL